MFRATHRSSSGAQTGIAASGFTCLSVPAAVSGQHRQTYLKPEAAITVFELLMMSGVSLETCGAIDKHWNNKFWYTVASCWLFLYDLYYDARIHEHQLNNDLKW
jgi:hypothetical protein